MKHKTPYTTLVTFLCFTTFLSACSQNTAKLTPAVQQHQYLLGSTPVTISQIRYSNALPIQFLHLHHDETTAGDVAKQFSDDLGIDYIQLLNGGNRLIEFKISGTSYRVDPNRMFTKNGIVANLKLHSRYNDEAFQAVYRFQQKIITLLDTTKTIIALHNNRDEEFTLADYMLNATDLVHRNPSLDPDDFFITTDSTIFIRLKEKDFNVALERGAELKDDGSLSIYCSRLGIRYVNVEAEHGHAKEQAAMLQALIEILK